jgi:ribonuclease BN (tRNA processing enzyme)
MFHAFDIERGGLIYSDSNVRVTAAENTHFRFKSVGPHAGEDKSYSYRFDTPAGSVVFTGDTGPSESLQKLAQGADVLVTEVLVPRLNDAGIDSTVPPELLKEEGFHMKYEHLSPEQIGRLATKAHVKTVVLTHFVPGKDDVTDMTAFTAGVEKHFSGTVVPGRDLLEYDLDTAHRHQR